MLDGTSVLRKVKTYMKHSFEHCLGVRAWSIGTYCSSRLNVMTLTELIHTLKHRQSSICISSILYQSAFEDNIISSGLYYLSPLTLAWPQVHTATSCTCVIDSDPRFICVCERMRRNEETNTSAVGDVLLLELASHFHWLNTLLHWPPFFLLAARSPYIIYSIYFETDSILYILICCLTCRGKWLL